MITVLDKNTINQIAAGEVIERPASVVKELTENSLDAGATAITIEIKDGGLSLIRITDNGSGIDSSEVRTAFLRHATSKIKSALDLLDLKSLGFRGEALSSIASIAKVEVITKTRESFTGTSYRIEGGEEIDCTEAACPDGATFLVRDIFFNTPVRRTFLKSPATEAGYINEVVEKLALSHTDIAFKFINNGKVLLHTAGKGKVRDNILELYGLDVAKSLIDIDASDEISGISISGVCAKPYVSRGNRGMEAFFVNGRYIKSKIMANALEDAYKGYMMGHNYPVAAIYLSAPAEFVDINVHPQKTEVRFSDGEALYRLIYDSVRNVLSGKNHIVSQILDEPKTHSEIVKEKNTELNRIHIPEPFEIEKREETKNIISTDINEIKKSEPVICVPVDKITEEIIEENTAETTVEITEKIKEAIKETIAGTIKEGIKKELIHEVKETENKCDNFEKPDVFPEIHITDVEQTEIPLDLYNDYRKEFKLIGQAFGTYWLIEMEDTLFLIDQHAAHEKVLFENTMKRLREKTGFMSQELFPPVIITLSLRETECLRSNIGIFSRFGFELEEFGLKEFKLTATPAELVDVDYRELFHEILDSLMNEREYKNPNVLLDRIATISCKAAVKGNNHLSYEEANRLINDMLSLENPYHCPHGRPTTISFTKGELEKKFKRII